MMRKLAIEIFLLLVVGLALGLFGPFGTFATPTALRIAYWMVFVVAGYAIFRPMIVVGRWLAETMAIPPLIGIGLAQVIAALPMTLLVASLLSGFNVAAALRWDGLGHLYFQVWLIGFLINALFVLLYRNGEVEAVAAVHGPALAVAPASIPVSLIATPAPAPFREQLPAGFGAVLALKGEDHYVRVIGEAREVLVLARMRDAIAGLGPVEGLQVHRSWWVARAAIASVQREGRAATLLLSSGHEVPVSRDSLAALRATGWLKGV